MSIQMSGYIARGGCCCLASCVILLVFCTTPSAAQIPDASKQPAAPSAPVMVESAPPPQDNTGAVSEAEQHFRRGVELYNSNLFLEALSEFNRALALDPQMDNAKIYREKCNGKLQVSAAGGDPTTVPVFETAEPGSVLTPEETPQLSAEEMKVKRVAELLKSAERHLANERYSKAVQLFEEVLIIAPDNQRAQEGLHQATLGASKEAASKSEIQVEEDKARIRRYVEDSKRLPEGADATGIKPYRITVPMAEEEYVVPQKKSDIERILASPVGIEFENIHLSEIVEFISDGWDVNIVIDDRVVKRPVKPAVAVPGAAPAGTPGPYPGMPPGAAPGPYPAAAPQFGGGIGGQRPAAGRPMSPQRQAFGGLQTQQFGGPAQPGYGGQTAYNAAALGGGYVTDGIVPYINLKDVTLREALKAILRPLNLDFSVQPGFIWISTPQRIREESFEELETRYYELRNAGAETLFKIVLRNPGGGGGGGYGGGMGGMGGGMGGYGGGGMGGYGGGMGGMGGGMGGYGGSYGGAGGGMGGMGGGYGGGGYGGGGLGGGGYGGGGLGGGGYGGGGLGGGGYGGGRMGGGGMGGYGGGGMGGYGGGMGGMGGGMMGGYGGGGGGIQIQNISQLFGSMNDLMVGETPAIIGTAGLGVGGTGTVGAARIGGGAYPGGAQAGYQQAGLGGAAGRAQNVSGDEPEIVRLLRLLVNDVYEPGGEEPISRMIYVPYTNLLIVHNTPTNLSNLEKQLAELDVTPKQVSIEAKFVTVRTSDLKQIGFQWGVTKSDLNNRARQDPLLAQQTYLYDVNGDGVAETVPFYVRPDGSNVIRNTVANTVLNALVNPGAAITSSTPGGFSLAGIITNNADGDKITATLDYLNTLDESELLSAPRVTTMNRKPAVIADLSTEYFVSQVYTEVISAQAGFGGTASLGYTQQVVPTPFNFGITLSVTPQISGGDQVRLWLNPQVTTRGAEKTFEQKSVINGTEITTDITLPNTSTQAVWTNVIVHDGDTLVLGGLVSDQTVRSKHKMPYLADIPVLGFFFRGKSKNASQSSLLIFVTPTVIDTTGARFFEAGNSALQTSRRTATVKGPGAPPEETAISGEAPIESPTVSETGAPAEKSAEAPAEKSAEAPTAKSSEAAGETPMEAPAAKPQTKASQKKPAAPESKS